MKKRGMWGDKDGEEVVVAAAEGENGHWGEREAHAVVPVGKEEQGEREQILKGGEGKRVEGAGGPELGSGEGGNG
jgi:hypothetical protein